MKYLRIVLRVAIIGSLMLMLLIALLLIRGIGDDRTRYRAEAVARVSNSTAGPQHIAGPLRVVPWTAKQRVETIDTDGKKQVVDREYSGYLVQAPKTLRMEGNMKPDVRRVRLYDVRIYEIQSNLKATFDTFEAPAVPGRTYGEPYLVVGVMDMRGLVGTPVLRMDGRALTMDPGTRDL
ncbi:MAG: inner membrane CreD family protein, partial [Xanthomonadaceae bacterium]|nr:inner membrane CreD family protein [Xanthomonadaceae bacterium]